MPNVNWRKCTLCEEHFTIMIKGLCPNCYTKIKGKRYQKEQAITKKLHVFGRGKTSRGLNK